MAKRKQREAAQPPNEPAAAGAAAEEPADKRRCSPRTAAQPAAKARMPALHKAAQQSGGSSAAAAAAAAAAGRAESDVDDAVGEEQAARPAQAAAAAGGAVPQSAQQAAEQEQEETGNAGTAEAQPGKDTRRWVGLYGPINRNGGAVRWGASVLYFPHMGSRERRELRMGYHATQEAAARIHDRAVIALHGRKGAAASGLLNFGVEQYPGEQQRYGPDLNSFLLQLCALGERWDRSGRRKERARPAFKGSSADHMRRMREKRLAKAATAPPPATHVQEGMAALRRSDPLHSDLVSNCGVCPPCRQPWRKDLGGCQRRAVAKSVGHREKAMQDMLAHDSLMRTAALEQWEALRLQKRNRTEQLQAEQEVAAANEDGGGRQQQAAGEAAGDAEGGQQAQPQQKRGSAGQRLRAALAAAGVGFQEEELEWLEEPPKPARKQGALQLQRQLRAMRTAAVGQLEQQQAWQEAQLAAAMEREEQQPGAGSDAGSGSALAAAAVGVGQVQLAEKALVDLATGLARAAAPHNVFPHPQAEQLLQLAELCKEEGLEAPLTVEAAKQALAAAERERARQERLAKAVLRRARRERDGSRGGTPDPSAQQQEAAEVEAAAAAVAASDSSVSDGEGTAGSEATDGAGQMKHCVLCGGKAHHFVGWKACPVVRMALAVPKPQPGCAHQEQPGCKQCLPSSREDKWRQPLEQRFVRRAPWLDDVLPATRHLMQAMQVAASAAVVDFDLPGAAWRCTPKALLAAGLLAEEAAKRELAARFPPHQQQHVPQQAQQAQAQQQPLPDG